MPLWPGHKVAGLMYSIHSPESPTSFKVHGSYLVLSFVFTISIANNASPIAPRECTLEACSHLSTYLRLICRNPPLGAGAPLVAHVSPPAAVYPSRTTIPQGEKNKQKHHGHSQAFPYHELFSLLYLEMVPHRAAINGPGCATSVQPRYGDAP